MSRRKPKIEEDREYLFLGTIELSGVVFFVKASSEDAATEKARAGDFEDYDAKGAETVNWEINYRTIELNE